MESGEPNSPTKPFQSTSCPKSYSFKSHPKEHIQSKHSEGECKSYSCTKCLDNKQPAKSFAKKMQLRKHMARVHGPHRKQKSKDFKYFSCEICPLKFSCRSNLKRHILGKHVVDKEFECVVCSKKFVDQETLDKHIRQHDKPTQYFCDICSKGFTATQSLIHHLGIVHLKFVYCYKCCRSYGNKSEFDQHSDPETSSELKLSFNCQMCGEAFDSQCNLDIHTNSHLTEIKFKTMCNDDLKTKADTKPGRPDLNEEFQCELCSKSFDRQTYLTAHRNQVHPNEEWTCSFPQCSKVFKKWYQLKCHKLTHLRTKPFACKLCKKAFNHPEQLEDHDLSHVEDKKYKCELCPKSFETPSNLKIHIANNHGGPKPFPCPVQNCGTTWATNCQLKSHLVSHETDRPFKCDMCTTIKAFKTLGQLKRHKRQVHLKSNLIQEGNTLKDKTNSKIRKHLDALVFICCLNNCPFETVENKNVALHYNLRHGLPKVLIYRNSVSPPLLEETLTFETKRLIQKRYKCRVCAAYIKLSSHFTQHQLTHSNETPFKCSHCRLLFKYQKSVNRHIRKVHKTNDAKVTNSFQLSSSNLSNPCHDDNDK